MIALASRLLCWLGLCIAVFVAVEALPRVAAQEPMTVFSLDVDVGTPGVQTSRAPVPVGEAIHLRVVLESFGAEAYGSYQVFVTYNTALVEPVGFPRNWGDAPTADSGGNVLQFASGDLCDPSPTTRALGVIGDGMGYLTMTCAELDFSQTTAATGDLVDIMFRCLAPGSADFDLSTADNTYLLDSVTLGTYSDVRGAASIQCEGSALTSTPAPAEATSAPGESTPGTANPTSAITLEPEATGEAQGSDADKDDSDTWLWLVIAGIVVAAVAVAIGVAVFVRRRP